MKIKISLRIEKLVYSKKCREICKQKLHYRSAKNMGRGWEFIEQNKLNISLIIYMFFKMPSLYYVPIKFNCSQKR